jgi:NADPH2:quinone reductase
VRVNRLLLNNLSVVGVGWGAILGYDETILTTGAAALDALYAEGSIRPPITQRFAFGSLPDALLALDRREVAGKGVIEGLAAGAVGGGR